MTLIESRARATGSIEDEFEHAVQYGDATELWVLERAGIQRADVVIAVTGDDEDNILVCQVAKEKYLCDRMIARVNNPRNHDHFKLLGIQPAVSATDLILRLIEHEVPALRADAPAGARRGAPGDHRARGQRRRPRGGPESGRHLPARGQPDHLGPTRRAGFVPKADTVIEAGDEVLLVLDPGLEEAITAYFSPEGQPVDGGARRVAAVKAAPGPIAR